jgi:hypothetical protein
MIYLKSVCVGLAFVLGAFYAIFFLAGIVLGVVTNRHHDGLLDFTSFTNLLVIVSTFLCVPQGSPKSGQ